MDLRSSRLRMPFRRSALDSELCHSMEKVMPTLTQPAIGNTAWGTQMNTNLQVLQNQLTNAMQGRLQRDSATQISLQRYSGDTVEVNGLNVSIGASGLARVSTDHIIDGSGNEVM